MANTHNLYEKHINSWHHVFQAEDSFNLALGGKKISSYTVLILSLCKTKQNTDKLYGRRLDALLDVDIDTQVWTSSANQRGTPRRKGYFAPKAISTLDSKYFEIAKVTVANLRKKQLTFACSQNLVP